MPVNTPHRTFNAAYEQWVRCRDAFTGTDAIKKAAAKYLPVLEGQELTGLGYQGYLNRALFYPAMARTVTGLAGLVFAKPPTVSGVAIAQQPDFSDVTMTGISLAGYGLELCHEALITGRVGVLVDMPDVPAGGPTFVGTATRPYWVTYSAENILNWRVERIRGKQTLTMVILQEEKEIDNPEDDFVPKCVRQYRVLQLVPTGFGSVYVVTVWQEDEKNKGKFLPTQPRVPLRRGQALSFIPFTFLGPTGITPKIEHPPLLDLVDVNLSHYRTSADQEHGAHFTALPTPFVTGHKLVVGETLGIGSGTAWILENPNATAGMIEFSGAGLSSLKDIKEEKRQLMATLGARMLETQKNTQEAAQTVRLRHAGERSSLSVLSDSLSQAVTAAMRWHLFWGGLDEAAADKALFSANPDVMDELSADDIRSLVATWQAGGISHKTVYYNLEWGEWTRPGVTFEQELEEINGETPPNLNLPPGILPPADNGGSA